jgi:acetoin utilization protein AcuB
VEFETFQIIQMTICLKSFLKTKLVLRADGTHLATKRFITIKQEDFMSKAIPTVQKYMSVLPHTIGFDQTLQKARDMMSEYKIRHLPVLNGGKLIGIITDRDIRLVLGLRGADPEKMTVLEAYTPEPYITSPQAKLNEVVSHLAEKKYGSVLVVDNGKLVGIITEVDIYKALADLLETRLA